MPSAPWEMPKFSLAPEKLQQLQQQYVEEATELWRQDLAARTGGDRRFAGEAWGSNPVSAFSAAVYLLNTRTLLGMAEAVEADEKTRARLRFAVEQWMAASAPSNYFAFNAEAHEESRRHARREHRQGHAEPAERRAAGPPEHDRRKRFRGRPQRRHHRRRRGVRERAVPAARIQAAHCQGLRAAAAAGAALHQQVLHPRPAARELADPLCGGAGPSRVRRELAQSG